LCDECHVSIQGTDKQISDALVVLGKQIVWKYILAPKLKKKTELTTSELEAALASKWAEAPCVPYGRLLAGYAPIPAPPLQPTVLLHSPLHNNWSTPVSRIPFYRELPMLPEPLYTLPGLPTIVMAFPSPSSTLFMPTITVGLPSPPLPAPLHPF